MMVERDDNDFHCWSDAELRERMRAVGVESTVWERCDKELQHRRDDRAKRLVWIAGISALASVASAVAAIVAVS